jgi:hypothetical protein
MTTMATNGDYDDNDDDDDEWQLCRRWHCKMICVYELCSDGVQKRRDKFFFFYFVFFLKLLFFSCSSSKATIRAIHYMIASSKTHKECTTQMLTLKPIYKEIKCMWGWITWCRSSTAIKPCVCVCVRACAPKTYIW